MDKFSNTSNIMLFNNWCFREVETIISASKGILSGSCVSDTLSVSSSIKEFILSNERISTARPEDRVRRRGTTIQRLIIVHKTPLHLQSREAWLNVEFAMIKQTTVPLLWGTSLPDSFVGALYPKDWITAQCTFKPLWTLLYSSSWMSNAVKKQEKRWSQKQKDYFETFRKAKKDYAYQWKLWKAQKLNQSPKTLLFIEKHLTVDVNPKMLRIKVKPL